MRQRSTLLLLVLAGALLVASTSGMSASSVHRGADVTVVPDDRAYIGVHTVDHSLDAGHHEAVTLVELENRFDTPLTDVTVTVTDASETPPRLNSYDTPGRLEPGEHSTVTASVVCDAGNTSPDTETWTLSIAVSGENVSVELTRMITVTCERTTPIVSNASRPSGAPTD